MYWLLAQHVRLTAQLELANSSSTTARDMPSADRKRTPCQVTRVRKGKTFHCLAPCVAHAAQPDNTNQFNSQPADQITGVSPDPPTAEPTGFNPPRYTPTSLFRLLPTSLSTHRLVDLDKAECLIACHLSNLLAGNLPGFVLNTDPTLGA